MRLEENIVIAATPEQVWARLDRLGRLVSVFDGLLTVEDADEDQEVEAGGRYRFAWHLGATVVGSSVEVIELVACRGLVWVSVTGTGHRVRIRLRPTPRGETAVTVRVAYEAPGPLGMVADLFAIPRVRDRLRPGLKNLKNALEASEPDDRFVS